MTNRRTDNNTKFHFIPTLSFLIILCTVITCMPVDEDFHNPQLVIIGQENLQFENTADSKTFQIESNQDWEIKKNKSYDWVEFTPMSGTKGTTNITVHTDENTEDERSCSVKVITAGTEEKIEITQAGKEQEQLNNTTIREIRETFQNLDKDEWIISEPLQLEGIVISDRMGANRSAKRDGFIQDKHGYGIAYRVTQSETPFNMGDQLQINLLDAKVHYFEYAGILQIIFSKMNVEVSHEELVIAPNELLISELDSKKHDGTLIKINDVQFREFKDLNYYSGKGNATKRLLECADGDSIELKTTKNASFKNDPLPAGKGNIVGIASYCKEQWEIQLRNLNDATEMSNDQTTRFQPEPPPVVENQICISALRASLLANQTHNSPSYIEGEVILNAFNKNVSEEMVYIADETAGIALMFSDKENTLTNVPIGAKVKIGVNGLKAKNYNGLLKGGSDNSLSTENVEIIKKKPSAKLVPKAATIDDILAGKFQSELVEIKNIQFKNIENTYSDTQIIVNQDNQELSVYTRREANFANKIVEQRRGSIVAVVDMYNSPQLLIRSVEDLKGMTEERFESSEGYISIDKTSVAFESKGGDETIAVSANVDWTAHASVDWISISPNKGVDDHITITAKENKGDQREATITFTDGTIEQVVAVKQKAKVLEEEEEEEQNDNDSNGLFFSEYIKGSSNNKYVEIFNGTGEAVDMSNYKIELYVNGQTNAARSEVLKGVLDKGEVVVYQHSKAAIYNGETIISSTINFNGNDAIALVRIADNQYVDILGCIGEDPGRKGWTAANDDELSTYNKTLVRKPSVKSGVTENPAAGFPTLSTEWIAYPKDTADNLGKHTMNR